MDPSYSPDGTKIAFTSFRDGFPEIYRMDANGSNPTRLTTNSGVSDVNPAFSPNDTKIAFTTNRDDNLNIYVMDAVDTDNDGNGDNLKRLTKNIASDSDSSFSPDGKKILFVSERNGNPEIYRMKAKPEGRKNRPRNLTNNDAANDLNPVFSPDGTQIAFATDRDGNSEIYKMNADGTNLVRLTNNTVTDGLPDWGVFVP